MTPVLAVEPPWETRSATKGTAGRPDDTNSSAGSATLFPDTAKTSTVS